MSDIEENLVESQDNQISEGEITESQVEKKSMPSVGKGVGSKGKAKRSEVMGSEVTELLQLMVKQQSEESKKVELLQNQLQSTSSKVDQVVIRVNKDEKRVFRKKGIEFQYRHNGEVLDNYHEMRVAYQAGKMDVLPSLIDKGMAFVEKRQRTLRFADEKGWVFVEVMRRMR